MPAHLVLFIAGAMAVGKSTLIERLMAGELAEVRRRLGLDEAEDWHVLDRAELPMLHAKPAKQVLCHYDILHAAEPFAVATKCRVVTLWAAPATLQERLVERDFHGRPPAPSQTSNWTRWSRRAGRLPRWLRDRLRRHFVRRGSVLGRFMRRTLGITPIEPIFHALERYRDPASISALYESWRELCVAGGAEQIFIDTTDGSYRFVEHPPWHDGTIRRSHPT